MENFKQIISPKALTEIFNSELTAILNEKIKKKSELINESSENKEIVFNIQEIKEIFSEGFGESFQNKIVSVIFNNEVMEAIINKVTKFIANNAEIKIEEFKFKIDFN